MRDAALTASGLVLADGSADPMPGCGLRLATSITSRPARGVEGSAIILDERLETSPEHWLLDVRYRLSILLRCGFDLHSLQVLTSPQSTSLIGEVLSGFGVDKPCLSTYDFEDGSFRIADLITPTSLEQRGRVVPLLRNWSLPHDEPNAGTGEQRRVFVVPSPGSEGCPRNAAELMEIGEQLGYCALHPDRHSPHEQCQLFASTSALVTCSDQALGWSLLCKPGTVVCSLRNSEHHSGYVHSSTAHVFDQHVGYVFGPGERKATTNEGFRIDPDDFESALDIAELYLRK